MGQNPLTLCVMKNQGFYEEANKATNRYLEDEFSQDSFAQVQSSINDHGAELDEQHDQEGLGDLVLWQW